MLGGKKRIKHSSRYLVGNFGAVIAHLHIDLILLLAYAPALLARRLPPGLSLGILLGALVIVASWVLTWVYVRWANTHYDTAIEGMRR